MWNWKCECSRSGRSRMRLHHPNKLALFLKNILSIVVSFDIETLTRCFDDFSTHDYFTFIWQQGSASSFFTVYTVISKLCVHTTMQRPQTHGFSYFWFSHFDFPTLIFCFLDSLFFDFPFLIFRRLHFVGTKFEGWSLLISWATWSSNITSPAGVSRHNLTQAFASTS